jgi:hypothetical protein
MTGDLSHILFSENAQLTAEALAGYNLYEWSEGTVHLIGVLPDGKPTLAKLADGDEAYFNALAPVTHAVSTNGERVFFYAEPEPGSVNLYMRENATQPQSAMSGGTCVEPAKACTTELDVSHGAEQSGGGVFWDASDNGSRVFFADERRLTANSDAIAGRPDLYEYDVETGRLTDLTPPLGGQPADVRGFSGASEDGSYLYFVTKSALTGAQENQYGARAESKATNLYLFHERTIMFIATLNSGADVKDWQDYLDARVSPSGQYLGFSSVEGITGFDNEDASTGRQDSEVFLYDAATNQIHCASCGAEGTQPTGDTELPGPTRFGHKPGGAPVNLSRNVLDDGRVFFTTPNALVSQDTNGLSDVYEYEEGRQYLISSGKSTSRSTFYESSATGEDVFFVTAQGLLRSDTDNNDSIYDARVGGGFRPNLLEEVEPPACEPEACRRPAGEAPAELSGASSLFSGAGNLIAAPPHEEMVKQKKRALTRAEKLRRALTRCHGEPSKKRRERCEAQARRAYGAKPKKSKTQASRKGSGR